MCDETSVREVCATQEPSTDHTWTKTCSLPPNIKEEVLREVLLHTNSPKVNGSIIQSSNWCLGDKVI